MITFCEWLFPDTLLSASHSSFLSTSLTFSSTSCLRGSEVTVGDDLLRSQSVSQSVSQAGRQAGRQTIFSNSIQRQCDLLQTRNVVLPKSHLKTHL